MLNSGETLKHYRVTKIIGEGAYGKVFRAEHLRYGSSVALKVMHRDVFAGDPSSKVRFIQEAEILLNLKHPNIVRAYEHFEWHNTIVIAEEYFGESLETIMESKTGLFPYRRAVGIFSQILDALQFAHNQGIIHRDIKPSNILLGHGDVAKLTDFGVAKVIGNKTMTARGTPVGTYAYMSPEAVKGKKQITQSDIYSLGITLFEMLTGKLPFLADSMFGFIDLHVNQEPPSPSNIYPHIPDYIEEVVLTALSKNPKGRFTDCNEFKNALYDTDWTRYEADNTEAEEEDTDDLLDELDEEGWLDEDDELDEDLLEENQAVSTPDTDEHSEGFRGFGAIVCGLVGLGIGSLFFPGVGSIIAAIIGGVIGYNAPSVAVIITIVVVVIIFIIMSNF